MKIIRQRIYSTPGLGSPSPAGKTEGVGVGKGAMKSGLSQPKNTAASKPQPDNKVTQLDKNNQGVNEYQIAKVSSEKELYSKLDAVSNNLRASSSGSIVMNQGPTLMNSPLGITK